MLSRIGAAVATVAAEDIGECWPEDYATVVRKGGDWGGEGYTMGGEVGDENWKARGERWEMRGESLGVGSYS